MDLIIQVIFEEIQLAGKHLAGVVSFGGIIYILMSIVLYRI